MQPVSAAFTAALPRRHWRTARVSWVSLDLATGTMTHLGELTGEEGVVTDGDVVIDRTRVVRRTGNLSIADDAEGLLTPEAYGDPLYLFSMLHLERGLVIDGVPEYVSLGYFVVDQPASNFGPRSGRHRVALSDRFSMTAEARLTSPLVFIDSTRVQTAIRVLAELSGLGTAETLYDLDDGGYTLGMIRAFEIGDLIPDLMVSLASDFGLDLYMNAQSVLTLEPFPDPNLLPTSYSFVEGDDAIVTEINRELSARGWYNVAIVIGEAPDLRESVVGISEVTDPSSPSHSSKIGVRVRPVRVSAQVRTQAQATAVADVDLYESALEEARIELRFVTHPGLEAGDVVEATYPRARLADRFILDVVRHPLYRGTSSFETRRLRSLFS
jgi:hypothetical protein